VIFSGVFGVIIEINCTLLSSLLSPQRLVVLVLLLLLFLFISSIGVFITSLFCFLFSIFYSFFIYFLLIDNTFLLFRNLIVGTTTGIILITIFIGEKHCFKLLNIIVKNLSLKISKIAYLFFSLLLIFW
jgi:hypothetical protein